MNRILSIDKFRVITMFLMIWVNNFLTLSIIPKWLYLQRVLYHLILINYKYRYIFFKTHYHIFPRLNIKIKI